MIVTDKQIGLDDLLVRKLDLMAERCTGSRKFDNLIIVDGTEGYGKSNISVACAYYLSQKTGRPFNLNHIFFDARKLIDTAKKSEDQIYVFDEAALVGLASQWQNKLQQEMITYFMTARKKRHIVFFNIPKFFRLNEYFILDRAIGLIHVYAKNEMKLGRFAYYMKDRMNNLYDHIKKTRRRDYNQYHDFRGTFPIVISNAENAIIDENEYDKRKDEAIAGIGEKESAPTNRIERFHVKLKYNLSQLPEKINLSKGELAKLIKIDRSVLSDWENLYDKYPDVINNPI